MLLRLCVLLSSIALAGCAKQKQDEVFIVPNGYVGPVVVVFEDPSGTDLLIEDTLVYFVDSDGIACVKSERPYGIFGADPVRVRDYDGTPRSWNRFQTGEGIQLLSVGGTFVTEYHPTIELALERCSAPPI